MYIKDGIAYSENLQTPIKLQSVRALDNYRLWIRFTNDEEKIFDFTPLLDSPAFSPLKDKSLFDKVYVEFGCPVWNNGEIDISPEYVYKEGIAYNTEISA